jgi:NAD(P)-dependent dehydrogenase (short-subunit alcohol dehydrogenase family)
MSDQKVVLILGAGSNIGQSSATAFASKGYKVALASRSAKTDEDTADLKHFQVDLSNPSSVPELFTQLKEALGTPSVVIYNGKYNVPTFHACTRWPAFSKAAAATANEKDNTFTVSVSDLEKTLATNTISPYAAAQQATLGFAELPDSASRTFIYTGNMLNTGVVIAPFMTLGVGKSATAHIIQHAATTFKEKGYK